MHRDKKLGLALGVLLVGIVGAFFFRLDHKTKDKVPQLNNSRALDKQIADKPGAPYTDDAQRIDDDAPQGQKKVAEPPLWQMPEFLADGQTEMPEDWLAQTPATPDPIQVATGDESDEMFGDEPTDERIVAHNVSQSNPSDPPAEKDGVLIHQVRSGDTLSALAAQYLGSSARFNDIYVLNREVLGNPNNLTVGTELRIPQRQKPSQESESTSLFHNADGQRRVDPQTVSTKKVTGPPNSPAGPRPGANSPAPRNAAPRQFVPVSKPPFAPGRRENQSSANNTLNPRRTLSQVPPADLPELD